MKRTLEELNNESEDETIVELSETREYRTNSRLKFFNDFLKAKTLWSHVTSLVVHDDETLRNFFKRRYGVSSVDDVKTPNIPTTIIKNLDKYNRVFYLSGDFNYTFNSKLEAIEKYLNTTYEESEIIKMIFSREKLPTKALFPYYKEGFVTNVVYGFNVVQCIKEYIETEKRFVLDMCYEKDKCFKLLDKMVEEDFAIRLGNIMHPPIPTKYKFYDSGLKFSNENINLLSCHSMTFAEIHALYKLTKGNVVFPQTTISTIKYVNSCRFNYSLFLTTDKNIDGFRVPGRQVIIHLLNDNTVINQNRIDKVVFVFKNKEQVNEAASVKHCINRNLTVLESMSNLVLSKLPSDKTPPLFFTCALNGLKN